MTYWDALSTAVSRTLAATAPAVVKYLPIILPPASNPAWARAETIARALRAKGKSNPFVVSALANGYAESGWRADVVGDHGQSFGPWQLKGVYYAGPIKAALGIDITDKATTLEQHVAAVLFALRQARVVDALDASSTGADATRIWCAQFERASAPGAVERRVAIAPAIEAWLAKMAA